MGEVPMNNVGGIAPKITSLLNNEMFSDVVFLFESDDRPSSVVYGHKLILALRSEYFATRFYKSKENSQLMKLPENIRIPFHDMLRFLYTDDVHLQKFTFEEVEDLHVVSKQFGVKELTARCLEYLLNERITIQNVFSRYEGALSNNVDTLLKHCKNFIKNEAVSVFESSQFDEASVVVVEDILKQDDLAVSTELTIVNAVLRWGIAKCKRENIPLDDKSLREQIYPFLKYLRFLTLSAEEFQSILAKHNIFTGYESTILTCKILQPLSEITIPEYVCDFTNKRKNVVASIASPTLLPKSEKYNFMPSVVLPVQRDSSSSSSDVLRNESLSDVMLKKTEEEFSLRRDLLVNPTTSDPRLKKTKEPSSREMLLNEALYDLRLEKREELSRSTEILNDKYDTRLEKIEEPFKSREMLKDMYDTSLEKLYNSPMDTMKSNTSQPKLQKQKSVPNIDKPPQPKRFSYEIKKSSPFAENNNTPQFKSTKFQSSPNSYPFHVSTHQGTFQFPLSENPQTLMDSFRRDVQCSATFKMKTGTIRLYGFDLHVKKVDGVSEKLEVDVELTGVSGSFSKRYKNELQNNVYKVNFEKPVLLREKEKCTLEVSIDNLYLNRCRVYSSDICELNCGYSCMCEISMKSNQKVNSGFAFLINQLYYSSR